MSAATLWCRRFAHLIRELARFAVVGAIGLLVTDGAFNLMISERQAALTANAVATLAAAAVTFLGSRYWTFRHRRRAGLGRDRRRRRSPHLPALGRHGQCCDGRPWPGAGAAAARGAGADR